MVSKSHSHCAQFKRGPKIFRKGTKRGPDFEQKGDLKGTKRGPKRGPKTRVVRKIEKSLYGDIFQKLNLDDEKTMIDRHKPKSQLLHNHVKLITKDRLLRVL